MASIQRTAYPRFKRTISTRELQDSYTPTPEEWRFAQQATRVPEHAFNMIVLLKVVQQLGYFPKPEQIPTTIIDHLRAVLQFDPALTLQYDSQRTLRDHHQAIRTYHVLPYSRQGRHVMTMAVYEAAQVDGLKTGDLALDGSERYADYRTHLLPWAACQSLLTDYCREVGLASTA